MLRSTRRVPLSGMWFNSSCRVWRGKFDFFSVDVSVVFSTPHSVHRILSSCKFSAGWVVSRTPSSPAAASPLGMEALFLDAGFSFLFVRWFYFLVVWSSSCSRSRSTGTRSH